MKVYCVNANDGSVYRYFATKRAAVADARRTASEAGTSVDVEEVTLVPMTKSAIVQLINNSGGYVEESRVIATFVPAQTESE